MAKRRRPRAETEETEESTRRDDRVDAKDTKKDTKKDRKVEILLAKAELSRAKSQKRKWLFALIAICLVAYYTLSSGAGSGILDKIKTFIPIGD